MNTTHFLAIYHLSLVCGPNFTLKEHFCLFVFTLDSSSLNRTHSIWTQTPRVAVLVDLNSWKWQ